MTHPVAPPTFSMLIQYTVLQLFNATLGCLAEIELAQSRVPASGTRHWLWIEGNTVTSLQLVDVDQPSKHIFDRAVLTFDGAQGELNWPGGRCDPLSVDATGVLRAEFRRLLHQHLN